METASAWWACVKVAALREIWCAVLGRGTCATGVGRDVDENRRHGVCARAAVEGRMVCFSTLRASFDGAFGAMVRILCEK
jgi:hypothetical protein